MCLRKSTIVLIRKKDTFVLKRHYDCGRTGWKPAIPIFGNCFGSIPLVFVPSLPPNNQIVHRKTTVCRYTNNNHPISEMPIVETKKVNRFLGAVQ